jgi:hypothetical protein
MVEKERATLFVFIDQNPWLMAASVCRGFRIIDRFEFNDLPHFLGSL